VGVEPGGLVPLTCGIGRWYGSRLLGARQFLQLLDAGLCPRMLQWSCEDTTPHPVAECMEFYATNPRNARAMVCAFAPQSTEGHKESFV
jgi:hypothetical protein